jgi:heme/copper-type cytochrome/quinol oxidase subunit 4
LILFLLLYFSMNQGFIDLLSPIFMFFYALILFLINQKSNKYLQIISGICALLAVICFLIPSYWYASILILGIAHITFGIVVKD